MELKSNFLKGALCATCAVTFHFAKSWSAGLSIEDALSKSQQANSQATDLKFAIFADYLIGVKTFDEVFQTLEIMAKFEEINTPFEQRLTFKELYNQFIEVIAIKGNWQDHKKIYKFFGKTNQAWSRSSHALALIRAVAANKTDFVQKVIKSNEFDLRKEITFAALIAAHHYPNSRLAELLRNKKNFYAPNQASYYLPSGAEFENPASALNERLNSQDDRWWFNFFVVAYSRALSLTPVRCSAIMVPTT